MPRLIQAKGVNFRGALKQLERRGGRPLVDRVLARLTGESGVLSPYESIIRVLQIKHKHNTYVI